MRTKEMTDTAILESLIRNGFKEKRDRKGNPVPGVLIMPQKPVGLKILGRMDYLKRFNWKFTN